MPPVIQYIPEINFAQRFTTHVSLKFMSNCLDLRGRPGAFATQAVGLKTVLGSKPSMLPPGHIEYTWGALNLLQRKAGLFKDADYRVAALSALSPDLIDKPLSLLVFTDSKTSQGLAHTLLVHLLVSLIVFIWWRKGFVYALAFNGHLLADRIWLYPRTLFFPFLGWQFEPWRFMGSPKAMLDAYTEIVTYPLIIALESIGLVVLAWLVIIYRLYRRENLTAFLASGRLPHTVGGGGEKVHIKHGGRAHEGHHR
jgi:inner membrane protein